MERSEASACGVWSIAQLHACAIFRNSPFVNYSVSSRMLGEFRRCFGRVFAILFEDLLLQTQEEYITFLGWEGGEGHQMVN